MAADQVETQSAETAAETKPVEQPAVESTPAAEEFNPFAEFDEMTERFNIAPESTQETPAETETTEQATETETPGENAETTSETAKVDDFQFPKIKWNGEEKELKDVLKTHPDLVSELEKRFDYTQKTQTLSKEREEFNQFKQDFDSKAKYLVLQNIALEVGGNPVAEPIFDPYAENNGEVKDGFVTYSDRDAFTKARKEYTEFAGKYQTYQQNVDRTNQENAVVVKQFEEKYKGVDTNGLIKEMMDYVNPSITKGQMPFPKDALEVFFLGKNHDRLLQEKLKAVDDEKKAEYKKGYSDALVETKKNGSKAKSIVPPVKVASKPKNDDGAWDEYEEMVKKYLVKT